MKRRLFLSALMILLAYMAMAQPVTITPPSANIEPGQSVTLTASGATYYTWSPATGLSTTEGPVVVASPMVTTTYTCSGYAPGAESVVNGNFDQGNVGFTSAYQYNTNLFGEGTYYVDYDASLHHENFVGLGHGGTGNFMIVNGATTPGINVWTEQITVVPNTYYAFSTWVCTLAGTPDQVALLQFSINGNQIGGIFSAPAQFNTWQQFYELWYSGSSTSATITILNQNTGVAGNDFGLDDISFCEIVLVGAPQCTVYVGSMSATATADDTELCEGESTTLHALPTGGSGNYSYSWTPANTLNNANIQHPVATPPVGTTTYICHITDNSWGNSQNVSVSIVVHPNEVTHEYDTICEGDTYDFYGQMAGAPGIYEHHEQTQYGCDKTIYLRLDNWPTYDETAITEYFCQGGSYNFNNQHLTAPGTYYDTLESIHHCDSIIRLQLIENPTYEYSDSVSTCEGGLGYYYNGDYLQPSPYPYVYVFESVLGCDSIVSLHVNETEYNSKTYNVSLCAEQYTWGSNHVTYYESGTYYDTLSFPNSCDSTLVLNLELRPSSFDDFPVTSCDTYHWLDPFYNVDTTFTESAVYTHTYINSYGCESEVTLYLTITDHDSIVQSQWDTTHITYPGVAGCDKANWPGDIDGDGVDDYQTNDTYDPIDHWYTFSSPEGSGGYKRTYTSHAGCDSIVTFPLLLEYTPGFHEIEPVDHNDEAPHWVVTATEFQINSYDFSIREDEHPTCHWDSIRWEFRDPCVQWILEPDETTLPTPNMKCKMYVLNYIPDTVWLDATVYNKCAPQGVTRSYWFVCSFYDIDEQTIVKDDFYVVPNPNNGQMTLHFEQLTGKIDVKVYDMRGTLIDNVQTYNEVESNSMAYNLKGSCGVYFFVVTGKEGVVAKKVIVR